MTYTAAGQLYYAITKTPSASGEYDYSWTWYDGAGSRVMAVQGHGDAPTPQDPHDYWSRRVYFLEDGPNVALQLGPDGVLERHVTAGLDAPVAVRRYSDAGPLLGTWTLVSDRQGSTLGALDSLGAQIAAAQAVSRNPFGAVEGVAPAGSEAPVSGYTGAAQSVSNGGGMVYLRNRWYDPQSGRFLTQDPIGLAGGVNLYAYAGNDPISFSDPFGLNPCGTSKSWVECGLQAAANWGARRGGVVGNAVLNAAAAADVLAEGSGVNFAAAAGDDIGSGHVARGVAHAALLIGGAKVIGAALGKLTGAAEGTFVGRGIGSMGRGSARLSNDEIVQAVSDAGATAKPHPTRGGEGVAIEFPDGTNADIRVETHPLTRGGQPQLHGNVEIWRTDGTHTNDHILP